MYCTVLHSISRALRSRCMSDTDVFRGFALRWPGARCLVGRPGLRCARQGPCLGPALGGSQCPCRVSDVSSSACAAYEDAFCASQPPPPRWLLWPDQAMCCARCSGRGGGGGPVAPDAVQRNGGAPLCATRDGCNHTLERPGRVFFKSFDPPPEFWPFLAFFRSYVL